MLPFSFQTSYLQLDVDVQVAAVNVTELLRVPHHSGWRGRQSLLPRLPGSPQQAVGRGQAGGGTGGACSPSQLRAATDRPVTAAGAGAAGAAAGAAGAADINIDIDIAAAIFTAPRSSHPGRGAG